MQRTLVSELPKDAVGNLRSKKHVLEIVVRHEDDCGSHGCTGHSYSKIICSCGFVDSWPDFDPGGDTRRIVIQRHKTNVMLEHLGIAFEDKT